MSELPGLLLAALLSGLVGSLHCVGMCGPLLVAFRRLASTGAGVSPVREFLPYHLGRLWTYVLLGAVAGGFGRGIARGSAALGWQRAASVALALLVLALGVVSLRAADPLLASGLRSIQRSGWFRYLATDASPLPRSVLGAVMGLLPCGLVYGMLAVAASLGDPLRGAVAMGAFGLGTLPALSALGLLGRLLPLELRARLRPLAGLGVLVAGAWMLVRALLVSPEACAFCLR